ncbi:PepSY domain-containing protein [Alkalihalobacillus sp. MEB130]|uniref:PepSY domain-containing protein n=1 Tax=Alkalihalobacillus sp. MEB130 TaxID=2976704 RepID=UPI0028DDAE34|nr:PepSY domain-containing protein [Alkalihalobacillus sp. MEB130]MDT8859349.1 PepSY domain-containing protein [Alkalihalobacillus sp. MEB130]
MMKRFFAGLGIGLAAGYILGPTLKNDKISPEKALKEVKKAVSKKYAISGSWIHMIPEELERNNISYTVYRGGLSTTTEEGTTQYEFLVDTKSGTLLDLQSS